MLDKLKSIITRNIGMKILAVLVAVIVWFMINAVIDPVQVVIIRDVPVALLNVDQMTSSGQTVEIVSGNSVSVKVRAKRSVADKLTAADFNAVVDVTSINEYNTAAITVKCPSRPDSEVEIISHETAEGLTTAHLSIEEINSQSFAVNIIIDGTVKEGLCIFSSEASPNLITITGSQTQLSKIDKVAVMVNVDNISGDLTQNCEIRAYDKNNDTVALDKLTLSESRVKVQVHLVHTKEIEVKVNVLGTPAEGYTCDTVEYAPHYITIAGDAADLDKIDSVTIECMVSDAVADIEKAYNVSELVNDTFGSGIKVVNEGQRISVRAIIEPLAEKSFTISTDSIELRNLDEAFVAEIQQGTVTVVLQAKNDILNKLKLEDIKAFINCQQYTKEGVQDSAFVDFELPTGVTRINGVVVKLEVKNAVATEAELFEDELLAEADKN